MTQPVEASGKSQPAPEATCPDVEELLRKVVADINAYEAMKLGELRTELEAFTKKRTTLVDEYRKKYPTLLARWCEQHKLIENLHSSLQCSFGKDWKKIVETCICAPFHDRDCLEERIEQRRKCSRGVLEGARDEAQRVFDKSRKHLDVLAANAQKIEAELSDDDALIKKIQATVPGPEQAVALYLFWFKLLPSHRRLAPAKLPDGCKNFEDENDGTLCKQIRDTKCETPAEGCAPPDGWKPPAREAEQVPKLIDPDGYGGALNCAFDALRKAKDELGARESVYRAKPDDLPALEKELKDLNTALEGKIVDCLKKHKPVDKCCPDMSATPAAGAASNSSTTSQTGQADAASAAGGTSAPSSAHQYPPATGQPPAAATQPAPMAQGGGGVASVATTTSPPAAA